jgi:hypothetical protein
MEPHLARLESDIARLRSDIANIEAGMLAALWRGLGWI